jgi:hypothetical protein
MVEINNGLLNGSLLTTFVRSKEGIKQKELQGTTSRDLELGKGNYLLYADFYEAIREDKLDLKITTIKEKKASVLVLKKDYSIGRDADLFINPKDLNIYSFIPTKTGEIGVYNKLLSTNLAEFNKDWNRYQNDRIQRKNIENINKIIQEFKEKLVDYTKERLQRKVKRIVGLKPKQTIEKKKIKSTIAKPKRSIAK